MNKSESIKELAEALSELQGEITDVCPSNKGHRHDYADLSDMLKVARPLLRKHGLSVSQLVGNAEDRVTVESVLMHKSGEWMSSTISVPVVAASNAMNSLQSIGSSITYARRYALGALLSFTKGDDDTDGNAVHHQEQKKSTYKPPVVPKPIESEFIDSDQKFRIETLAFEAGVTIPDLLGKLKIKNLAELAKDRYEGVMNRLQDKVVESMDKQKAAQKQANKAVRDVADYLNA